MHKIRRKISKYKINTIYRERKEKLRMSNKKPKIDFLANPLVRYGGCETL